ncbi:hypothetical protein ABTF26_20440, partial [Acinetobacter baumannii]
MTSVTTGRASPPRLDGEGWMRIVEIAVLCASISIAVGSYFIITAGQAPRQTLTPLLAASLLVANLLP